MDLSSTPVPFTQLEIPCLREGIVRRSHLLDRLNLRWRLAVVSAPPGYGKTTAVVQWLGDQGMEACWLSLSPRENDPADFLGMVVQALRRVFPDSGTSILAELRSPEAVVAQSLLPVLIHELHEVSEDFCIVLDDAHEITDPRVHGILEYVVSALPAHVRLILVGRSDPPIPVARLRAAGDLVELRAKDLAFSRDEVDKFLQGAEGTKLRKDDVVALGERFEGWIAGIQLATLSLKETSDPSQLMRDLRGDHRYIADYLTEEVLSLQDPAIREFLLKTSVLEQLSAPLCDAVTGAKDSGQILRDLERSNLFLVPLDDSRTWYRYHQLFADLLRVRLPKEDLVSAHEAAGRWFQDQGAIPRAIDHLLEAEAYEDAATLVASESRAALMRRGETSSVARWADRIPQSIRQSEPRIELAAAWANIYRLDLRGVGPLLSNVTSWLEETSDPAVHAEVNLIQATVGVLTGQGAMALEGFDSALAQKSIDEDLHALALVGRGYACLALGRTAEAQASLSEAVVANEGCDFIAVAMKAACFAAVTQISAGKLRAAQDSVDVVRRLAHRHNLERAPVMALAYCAGAEIARERDELQEAAELVGRAQEAVARGGDPLRAWVVAVMGARIRYSQGSTESALTMLKEAESLVDPDYMPLSSTRTAALRIRMVLGRIGPEAEDIHRWRERFEAKPNWLDSAGAMVIPGQSREFEHLTLARIHIAGGRSHEALTLCDEILPGAEKASRERVVAEAEMLRALALRNLGDPKGSKAAMGRALRICAPEKFVRLFLDEGAVVAPLLRDSEMTYARELDIRLEQLLGSRADSGGESLSGREIEILELVAAGCTNVQLAERLFISPNTVKTHLKSILSKLGVHTRHEAVTEAKKLGVL